MQTTLNKIRAKGPCQEGWYELLRYLNKIAADDEPLSFETILKAVGIEDAVWCLQTLGLDRKIVEFAIAIARAALAENPSDRMEEALGIAERWMQGLVSQLDLDRSTRLVWLQRDGYFTPHCSYTISCVAYAIEATVDYSRGICPAHAARYCNLYSQAKPEQREEIFLRFFGEENANNP